MDKKLTVMWVVIFIIIKLIRSVCGIDIIRVQYGIVEKYDGTFLITCV